MRLKLMLELDERGAIPRFQAGVQGRAKRAGGIFSRWPQAALWGPASRHGFWADGDLRTGNTKKGEGHALPAPQKAAARRCIWGPGGARMHPANYARGRRRLEPDRQCPQTRGGSWMARRYRLLAPCLASQGWRVMAAWLPLREASQDLAIIGIQAFRPFAVNPQTHGVGLVRIFHFSRSWA